MPTQLNYPIYTPETRGLVATYFLDFNDDDDFVVPLLGWFDNVEAKAKTIFIDNYDNATEVVINSARINKIVPAYSAGYYRVFPDELSFTIAGIVGYKTSVKLYTADYPEDLIQRGPVPDSADPLWSKVFYLLHCDDAAGATTVFNERRTIGNVALTGGANITNTVAYLGAGCIQNLRSNTGMSLSYGFYSGATSDKDRCGTLEFYAKLGYSGTGPGQGGGVFSNANGGAITAWVYKMDTLGSSRDAFILCDGALGNIKYQTKNYPYGYFGDWGHWSFEVNEGFFTIYFNGEPLETVVNTYAAALTNQFTSIVLAPTSGAAWMGSTFLDELRLTRGVARYKKPFVPPSRPFVNY